jgi:hypothetical protein
MKKLFNTPFVGFLNTGFFGVLKFLFSSVFLGFCPLVFLIFIYLFIYTLGYPFPKALRGLLNLDMPGRVYYTRPLRGHRLLQKAKA